MSKKLDQGGHGWWRQLHLLLLGFRRYLRGPANRRRPVSHEAQRASQKDQHPGDPLGSHGVVPDQLCSCGFRLRRYALHRYKELIDLVLAIMEDSGGCAQGILVLHLASQWP